MNIPHTHNPIAIGILSVIVIIAVATRKLVYGRQTPPTITERVSRIDPPNYTKFSQEYGLQDEKQQLYIQRQEQLLKRVDDLQKKADKLLEDAQKQASK